VVGLLLTGCGTAADTDISTTIGNEHQDEPADPMNALQTRVSKVRRALAAAAVGWLMVTSPAQASDLTSAWL